MPLIHYARLRGQRWLKANVTLSRSAEVAGILGGITILVGVAQYCSSKDERTRAVHYQAWQAINSAHGQRLSGGRIDALQDLARDGVSLEGADLDSTWLVGIRLRRARLNYATLRGANLAGAQLRGAQLKYTTLRGAKLDSAQLQHSEMYETDFEGANLRRANFDSAQLNEPKLKGASLRGTSFVAANIGYIDLTDTEISANLSHAYLEAARLSRAKLSGSTFRGANLDKARLDSAVLRAVDLTGAILIDGFLPYADLQYANLSDARLERAHLRNANLSFADLKGVDLTCAYLGSAIMSVFKTGDRLRALDWRWCAGSRTLLRDFSRGPSIPWELCRNPGSKAGIASEALANGYPAWSDR